MQIVDLQYVPGTACPVVHVSQMDVGRQFQLRLFDGTSAYSMPSGTTAFIDGIKPDKKVFSYSDAVSVSGNVVTVTTKLQMTVVSGMVDCEIRFKNNGTDIGTLNFKMMVEASPVNEDADMSESDIPAIIALATEQMLTAEAYAKGTRNGVPVTSGQTGYHDNSKYYKEETQQYVSQAQTAAQSASSSATSAAGSATSASNSATAAANSATSAANSATSAAGSATTATNKATVATEQALKAEGYAVGEQNAQPVTSGPYFENNSKYYAEEAADSASAAATSETNASASATTATQKSSEAEGYAEDSEAWAKGTRNGVNVPESDETYQNNSKYYADLSAQEAVISKAWAVGPNGSGVGSDTNNSKYWSEQSHFYSMSIAEAMNTITAYVALIRMLFDKMYIATEAGDRLITESGDYIIMDY